MCTYNGARFVREQLESIARQTHQPDRLLIVDDCSKDETPAIVAEFAASAPFPVDLVVNPTNLGWIKNFEKAVNLCDADLIALADQDDYWMPDKLERQWAILQSEPDTGMVIANAEVVDQELQPLGFTTWTLSDQAKWTAQDPFLMLLRYNMAQGATTVFRSRYRSLIMPTPSEWSHDAWIGLLVAAVSRVGIVSEPLIKYRQHGNNQLAHTQLDWRQMVREIGRDSGAHCGRQMVKFKQAYERLQAFGGVSPQKLEQLQQKIEHLRVRATLPRFRPFRLYGILAELCRGRYRNYSRGLRSAGRDLLA